MMKESFLQYLWQYSLFAKPLKLINGTSIEIIDVGSLNNDAGPDFFNAKVKIENTIWAGNIEIHVKSSDWIKHKHGNNIAYDNIILHVVAENDVDIKRQNGEIIPTAILKSPALVYEQYIYLMQNKNWVPCESFLNKINDFTIFEWKESLMIERLKTKAAIIERRWINNNKDYNETFYQTLAANFGFKTNTVPFEMLAKQVPYKYLLKHKDAIANIEAMLFGASGLLPKDSQDGYVNKLIRNFNHFQNKFNIKSLNNYLWKYAKLRPSNFPPVRVAQFAALIFKSEALLSNVTEMKDLKHLQQLFELEASEYWQTHYVFEKKSHKRVKRLGESAFQNIVINTIAPFFAFYAHVNNLPEFNERAIDWLMLIKPEQNNIIKHWQQLDLSVKNAFDSQSLIQLKNLYCNTRNCLNCRIGNQVIQHKF